MEKNKVSQIIKQFLENRFSADTEEKVQKWIIEDEKQEEKAQSSLEYWDSLDVEADQKTYAALERINKRLHPQNRKRIPLRRQLLRVAAVLIPFVFVAGGYFYYSNSQNQLVEISVAYGEEKQLILPDGSEVWMNAGTTLKYPKDFKNNNRSIFLSGEAYFSVIKDEERPFIVEANNISVKVLGTRFNVKAYPDEHQITTTLTSGKVQVNTNREDTYILEPNQQLTFNKDTKEINIHEIASEQTTAWINGQLIFMDATIDEIMQTLERRFDVSININNPISSSKLYTVKFYRNENLEDILDILEDVIGFSYTKQDNSISIIKNNSKRF